MDLQPANDLNPETKLYQLVQNWFKLHPGTLIPLDAWNRKLQAYGLANKREFEIQTPHHVLTVENPGMIPLLAAISLGDDLDYLAKLVTHHSCSFYDSDSLGVSQFNEGPKLTEAGPGIAIMSRPRIERLFIGAILKNPEQLDEMRSYIDVPGNTIAIPVVLSDQENLWPDTLISEYVSRARAGEESTGVVPRQMSLSELMDSDLDLTNTSDDKILTMLRRGGILNDDARVEHSCSNFFFENLFDAKHEAWKHGQAAIIRALNNAPSDDRATIARKLTGMVFERPANDAHHLHTIRNIYRAIDSKRYPEIVESPVFKVNLLCAAPSLVEEVNEQLNINFKALLPDIALEIMGTRPQDLRNHHFRSLGYLAGKWGINDDAGNLDINDLVKHVMSGFSCFMASPSQRVDEIDEGVSEACEQFLKMSLRIAPPDYDKLNVLDSHAKRFMVSNGYKIKYFKGMTYEHKGQVLSDDLGL